MIKKLGENLILFALKWPLSVFPNRLVSDDDTNLLDTCTWISLHTSRSTYSTPNAPHKTTPSSIFPTLLSLLLSQAQGLNCPPYFPVSSMEPSPEDSILAMFHDSVPHFKIHSQHRSARLHYLLKNKLKQTLFHDLFYDL